MTPREIAAGIVRREGGYVNDPDDPGGATKHGVTIGTMRALGLDLDGDGDVDVQDVRRLTVDEAIEIYLEHYFVRPRVAELPSPLQATVFDMYVNSGANAVRILPGLLVKAGWPVAIDGVIGPETLAAAEAACSRHGELFADAYGIERRSWHYALADRRTASRKYARRENGGKAGWITRAEEFVSPRFRLTEAEHRARTAAWA